MQSDPWQHRMRHSSPTGNRTRRARPRRSATAHPAICASRACRPQLALAAAALVAEPREARMLARAYKSFASTTNRLVVRSRGSRARRISILPHSDMRTAVCQPSPRAWSTRRLKARSSSDRRAQLTGRRTHLAWTWRKRHLHCPCRMSWLDARACGTPCNIQGVYWGRNGIRAPLREAREPMWTSSNRSVPGALRRACDPQLAPSAVGIGVSVRRG